MLLIDLGIVWIFIMEGGFDALVTIFWQIGLNMEGVFESQNQI